MINFQTTIWPIDSSLTISQSGSESNGNKKLLYIS